MVSPHKDGEEVTDITGPSTLPTVSVVVLMQFLLSLTVIVYGPGARLVNTGLLWNVTPLRLYCNAPVPPVPVAVMVPSFAKQEESVEDVVTVGPAWLITLILKVRVHKFASRTVGG